MERQGITLRTAHSSDAEQIALLHAASWRYAYRGALSDDFLAGDIVADRLAIWTTRLQGAVAGQHVVVAEQSKIIGFACAYCDNDDRWGTLLDNLHVSPCYQGRGVGRSLMTSIAKWCEASALSKGLFLWVLQLNTRAQRFYEGLGGSKTGSNIWSAPGGGEVPQYRYAWSNVKSILSASENTGAA